MNNIIRATLNNILMELNTGNIAFCAYGTEHLSLEELKLMSSFIPKERIEKSKIIINLSIGITV